MLEQSTCRRKLQSVSVEIFWQPCASKNWRWRVRVPWVTSGLGKFLSHGIAKSCMTSQRTLQKKARQRASWQILYTLISMGQARGKGNAFRNWLRIPGADRWKDGCARYWRKNTSIATASSVGL